MDEKKIEKKKATIKRNKRDWLMFKFREAVEQEQDRVQEMEALLAPVSAPPAAEAVSSKLDAIRNRNTGRVVAARERWNRFATTAGSGGRGL